MYPTDAILAVIPDHHIPSQAIIKDLKSCTSPLSKKYSEPTTLRGVVAFKLAALSATSTNSPWKQLISLDISVLQLQCFKVHQNTCAFHPNETLSTSFTVTTTRRTSTSKRLAEHI